MDAFAGIRIIEVGEGVAAPLCGLYFADLGAEVIKVEPPTGDRARGWGRGHDSELIWRHLNRGKSVVRLPYEELASALSSPPYSTVDALVVHLDPIDKSRIKLDCEKLADGPGTPLVVCEIADIGFEGPLANWTGSELVVQAMSGMTRYLGQPGREPLRVGYEIAGYAAGAAAFQALAAGLIARHRDGKGKYARVCSLRALLSMKSALMAAQSEPDEWGGFHLDGPYAPVDAGWKTADGRVTFDFRHDQRESWADFCRYIGLGSLVDDPDYADWRSTIFTGPRRHDLGRAYHPYFEATASAAVSETITRFGGISVKVQKHEELLEHPQVKALAPFVESEGERQLGLPFKLSKLTIAGEPRRQAGTRESASIGMNPTSASLSTAPLAGLRVLDATIGGVGPWAASLLGMLGADVIKIESPQGDFIRNILPKKGGLGTTYISLNTNKRGTVADMRKSNEGERVLRLARRADVFLENFRKGTAEKIGLGHAALSAGNPRLIYVSASGFGRSGPLADLGATDPHLQAFAGLAALNGCGPGDEQFWRWYGHVDVATAMSIVQAVLVAIWQRRVDGQGLLVEASMLSSALALQRVRLAETLGGELLQPMGSAVSYLVPDQAFAALDEPVIVSATTDAQWKSLCDVLGLSDMSANPGLATNAGRIAARETVVECIARAIGQRPAWFWVERLQAVGVPSARLMRFPDFCHHEHYLGEGLVTKIPAPTQGSVTIGGSPWTFPGSLTDPRTGPQPGQHSQLLADEPWSSPSTW